MSASNNKQSKHLGAAKNLIDNLKNSLRGFGDCFFVGTGAAVAAHREAAFFFGRREIQKMYFFCLIPLVFLHLFVLLYRFFTYLYGRELKINFSL